MGEKHTPGPLHVVQDETWPYRIMVCDQDGNTVYSEPLACSSSAWRTWDDVRELRGIHGAEREEWIAAIERQRADMYLRAAAPDLLAACHGMVELLSGRPMSGIEGEQRLQAALAAIAKATPTDTKPAGEGEGA